ncbi:hypothetical protein Hsw_0938 [Hymenobacter swuensis DY53]|uniref:Uncharacterized protein n=2 Tax=Hymenobacter TaxID=89966 RepID=W8EVJ1_9BACT|nr:hypothetical protein Hsw_0938 [Hymenobacter swuensis DY53]
MTDGALAAWLPRVADYLEVLAYCSLSIPAGVALVHWQRLTRPVQLLAVVPAFMLVLFTLMRLTVAFGLQNIWLAHLAAIGETVCYICAFSLLLPRLRPWRRWLLGGFLAFAALDSLVLEGLTQLNSYTIALESFLGILLVLLYFEQEIRHLAPTNTHRRPLLIAGTGIVLYLAGTVAIYLGSNTFLQTDDGVGMSLLYSINSMLLLVLAAFFTRAFWLSCRIPASELQVIR